MLYPDLETLAFIRKKTTSINGILNKLVNHDTIKLKTITNL